MTRLQPTFVFVLKLIVVSAFISAGMTVFCLVAGLFLYTLLDPLLAASDLSNFALFFGPYAVVGFPAVFVASRLILLRERPRLVAILLAVTFVFGTLGFAGFMVAAMGI